MLHVARWTQKIAKNSPSARHRTTLSGYIFATKACIDNREQEGQQSLTGQRAANFRLLANQ